MNEPTPDDTTSATLHALEHAGCEARRLTAHTIGGIWRWIDSGKPFYVADPTRKTPGPDGAPAGLRADGLSIYSSLYTSEGLQTDRHVARFGDWVVRHPNGTWSVHKNPAPAKGTP